MSISIVLADDHTLLREGIRALLEEDLCMKVVGQAADGRRAVELVEELHPDVVIMDVHMPILNGIDATKELVARGIDTKIIALSMDRGREFVTEMFKAGAHAYVIKHSAIAELECAINAVKSGKRYISQDLTDTVIQGYVEQLTNHIREDTVQLTSKERQVLQLIAEGHSTREIASLLYVSVSTIETHRQHLMQKLDTHSIAGLTKAAIRLGLTEA
ncbi:MAG: DNA-binding response regulator [Ectothiorhodospiraceae bacterium]|nr:DNA-binding response regulator [Ectothiorhodospiraceae bacterium]